MVKKTIGPAACPRVLFLVPLFLLPLSCVEDAKEEPPPGGGVAIEAASLLGVPLPRPTLSESFASEQERLLTEATAGADAGDLDAMIWRGRRLAYLGRYREAIDHYTGALDTGPFDRALGEARLLRHRGHRYLTVRRLPLAIADFERAATLIEGEEDRLELDGLPNALNAPRSTLGTNIFYHLGLAHYLRADWHLAIDAYRRCLELSKNADMQVATSYWLVLALARQAASSGHDDLASAAASEIESLLSPITGDLDVIENHAYQRLLLAFKGELEPGQLLDEARAAGGQAFATTAYGVAAWAAQGGDQGEAEKIWREILDGDAWPSFGHLAAEAEIARLEERMAP